MSEKTEKAAPFKLKKAKEKGQVSKSMELTTYLSLLVLLGVIRALWPRQALEMQFLTRRLFHTAANTPLSLSSISYLNQCLLSKLMSLYLPFALAILLSIILISMAQTGLVWSTQALTPDVTRLHWGAGDQKIMLLSFFF